MTRPARRLAWGEVEALRPCREALAWGRQRYAARDQIGVATLVRSLERDGHWDWASWLLMRLLPVRDRVAYAIDADAAAAAAAAAARRRIQRRLLREGLRLLSTSDPATWNRMTSRAGRPA